MRLLICLLFCSALTGCKLLETNGLLSLGTKFFDVATLSDKEIQELSAKSCAEMDSKSKIAPANSRYTARLNRITRNMKSNINGVKPNFKVYLTKDVNAWAMANGCVRVHSGLMDVMNDNELQGILAHEMGHIALGHSKNAIKLAYSAQLAKDTIDSSANPGVSKLTKSQFGDMALELINAQFSQRQELEADNYAFDYLVKHKISPNGLATSFDKLAEASNDKKSLFSSHPTSKARAENIRKRLNSLK